MRRLVDANLNRAREGLRLLEDVARFTLNDGSLSRKLKDIRHHLAQASAPMNSALVTARDSEHDVGAETRPSTDLGRPDLPSLIVANSRRVEESLRVLEEATRTPAFEGIDWMAFQKARFALYGLEKSLLSRATREGKRKSVRGVYLVLDTEWLHGGSELDVARAAIRGGATLVQLRDKRRSARELLPVAKELKHICAQAGVLFVMNDHLDLALAAGADCLHLGQSDLPVETARALLPIDMMLGISTHSVDQAEAAAAGGADYVAFGAIFSTQSKHSITIVGTGMLGQVRARISPPLVAIGGINMSNAPGVIAAGADAVAVISAIMASDDVEKATKGLVNAIKEKEQKEDIEAADRQS